MKNSVEKMIIWWAPFMEDGLAYTGHFFQPVPAKSPEEDLIKIVEEIETKFPSARATFCSVPDLPEPCENSYYILISKGVHAGTIATLNDETEDSFLLRDGEGQRYSVGKAFAKALPYYDELKEQWQYVFKPLRLLSM